MQTSGFGKVTNCGCGVPLPALLCAHLTVVQEEEMRRAAEEKQRAEDEEAAKWMNMISVEDTVGVGRCLGGFRAWGSCGGTLLQGLGQGAAGLIGRAAVCPC